MFIRRNRVSATIERDEEYHGEPCGQRQRQTEREGIPIARKGKTGVSEKRNTADKGSKDRQADDPRGQISSAGHKAIGAAPSPKEPAAQRQHGRNVDDQDYRIQRAQIGLRVSRGRDNGLALRAEASGGTEIIYSQRHWTAKPMHANVFGEEPPFVPALPRVPTRRPTTKVDRL